MAKPVVLFGAGDIAEIAKFYLTEDMGLRVSAFTVDPEFVKEDSFAGLPVVPFGEVETAFPPANYDFFVAVSYTDLNRLRAHKCREALEKGYNLISYVSSKATVWPGLQIGRNCFILEDNTIQPFVRIGDNVTLWSGNHIGHHSVIEDDCFISSHVVISGGVVIEQGCFLGVNATLRDHIRVGRYSVIGAGAVLLKDAPEYSVYRSVPTERMDILSTQLRRI